MPKPTNALGAKYVAAGFHRGFRAEGNIDLTARPQAQNQDGTTSTVRSMSVNIDRKEVLLPTVSEHGRLMSDQDAVGTYHRTGRHLGIFDTPAHATAYAEKLHQEQAASLRDMGKRRLGS